MSDYMSAEEKKRREEEEARRRDEYINRLRESTRKAVDRVRRSEQLTAEDLAFRVNARDL